MKKIKYYTVFLVLFSITIVNFFSFTSEDLSYSEVEYRKMASFPEYSLDALLNGSYFSELEAYNLDQIAIRNEITNVNSYFQNLLQVKIRNGYVIIDNEFLLPFTNYRSVNLGELELLSEAKVSILANLKESASEKRLVFIDIPEKEYIYHKKMPYGMIGNYDYVYGRSIRTLADAEKLGILSLSNQDLLMSHINDNIYYKSDHHYTLEGATYVYEHLLNSINQEYGETFIPEPWSEMKKETPNKGFSGSAARAIGDVSFSNKDIHTIAFPKRINQFTRLEGGEQSDLKLLGESTPATYGNLMSGDRAHTIIKTERPDYPSILFIGDSFTNALEYLAVNDFNEVHSLDPRHYTGSIYEYVNDCDVDYVVIVRDSLLKPDYYR